MRRVEIVGWKSYGVAVLAIFSGLGALYHHQWGDALKGIVGGLALIALRDAIGKILRAIDDNRRALNNMRAAIEMLLDQHAGRR